MLAPECKISWAMIFTIVLGGVSATAAFGGYTLGAPDLQQIVDGEVAEPETAIIENSLGFVGTKMFLIVALTTFLSCTLYCGPPSAAFSSPSPGTRCFPGMRTSPNSPRPRRCPVMP